MTKAWAPQQQEVEVGDGDILALLKRVSMQYAKKAAELRTAGKTELAKYYDEMASNVDKLINQ